MASAKQKQTAERIKRIDPNAQFEEVGEQMFATYVPAWERGRHKGGQFVPNPNPEAVTMFVDVSGKLWGWGFGNESKVPVKLARPITQKADMADALKERASLRNPPNAEPGQKPEEPKPS